MTSPQWFAVERITGERKNDHGETTHFRVKWANYPDAESTWVPVAGLRAEWAIQAFREAEEKRRRWQRQRTLQKAALVSQPAAPTIRTPALIAEDQPAVAILGKLH